VSCPYRLFTQNGACLQFLQQRLRVREVGGIETLGEPAADVGEHRARFVATALRCEQPRKAHRRAQLE